MAILMFDRMRAGSRAALLAMALTAGGCMLFSQLSPREAPLAFNHAFHIEQGLECADCHAGVESGAEPGMPTSPQCMLCHENQDRDKPPEKKVSSLFVDQVFQAKHFSRLPNEVIFSHASHLARGQECAACHGEVASSHRVEAAVGVTMEECLACHASKGPSDDCANCHRETRKDQKPPTHDLAWRKTHGKVVRAHSVKRTDRCSLCHSESTCTSCHSDTLPDNHNNFWRVRGHGIAAAMDRQNCAACHRPDSCERCHEETRPLSHTGIWGTPSDRHCNICHFPLASNTCVVCHKDDSSHLGAPSPPNDPQHQAATENDCRICHGPILRHPDNGVACRQCHR